MGGGGQADAGPEEVAGRKFLGKVVDGLEPKALRPTIDEMKAQLGSGIAGFFSHVDDDGTRRILGETISHTGWIIMIFQIFVSRVAEQFRAMPVFMIGLLLFILPGIWIAVRMAFAEFYLVEKREQPVESMRSSFTANEQPFWTIVVVFLVPPLLLILLQLLLTIFVVAL